MTDAVANAIRLADTPQYIDGAWRPASGPAFDVIDPSRGTIIASLASSTADDVGTALIAARAAQPAWARTPIRKRGDLLRAIADAFARNHEELESLLVKEVG